MGRKRNPLPTYRLHRASGQAFVEVSGKRIYLGPHGTEKSRQEYRRVCHEIAARRLAEAEAKRIEPAVGLTVAELMVHYLEFAEGYYRKDSRATSEIDHIRSAFRFLKPDGDSLAVEFGPLRLKAVRDRMIAAGIVRNQINKGISRIKRCFRWGVEHELVPPSVYQGLAAVAGLRRGRSEALEMPAVEPVPFADVKAVLRHLAPQIAAMVKLQIRSGARPGEIVQLRPCDIDRSGDVWVFRPKSYKGEHTGRDRLIFFGRKCQRILTPWLDRPAEAYCFSPREVVEQSRAARRAARRTLDSCGNRPGTNRRDRPKKRAGEKYTTESYGRAIRDACRKAGIGVWSPHRLRHLSATWIRKQFGLEAAQVFLGHASANVTQVYAQRDFAKAAEIAKAFG